MDHFIGLISYYLTEFRNSIDDNREAIDSRQFAIEMFQAEGASDKEIDSLKEDVCQSAMGRDRAAALHHLTAKYHEDVTRVLADFKKAGLREP